MKKLRIVLAQLNFTVGNIEKNVEMHIRAAQEARDKYIADMIIFSELSITGYTPEDLLYRKELMDAVEAGLKKLQAEVKDIYCLVGHPQRIRNKLYNACSLIYNGKIIAQYAKQALPNYGIFDEARYFIPGEKTCVVSIHDIPIGIVICEDAWRIGPIIQCTAKGARLIIVPNASPFETDKHEQRLNVLQKKVAANHVPILYVNTIGGQDELVFDGGSMVINETGKISQFAGFFNETLLPVDITFDDKQVEIVEPKQITVASKTERIYQALVLSIRDYVEKNHFPGVLVGLSGGIDSALTLTLAVDALGKNRVKAIMMPSQYTSDISHEDADALLKKLQVKSETISIELSYQAFLTSLAGSFTGKKTDVTEENIQARCRAVILMAISNKTGWLVLTTGNRSELAVGYCTLYGDMAGGFAVLKDVPKTLVYELAHYRNQLDDVIPKRTIERAPTAELAPNQKDEDSIPSYAILDQILEYYLNQTLSAEDIIQKGFDADVVHRVIDLIRKSEYKRKQSTIGPNINQESFGKDWRYPITNGFKK